MFDDLINKTFKHNGYAGISCDVMIVITKNRAISFGKRGFHCQKLMNNEIHLHNR